MNKILNKFMFIAAIFAALAITSCTDDIPEEITELELSRLLSPTGLSALVVDQTAIRLSWKPVRNAQSYTVEIHENGDLNFDGTPVRTVEGVLLSQLPITIRGFAGETSYSVRVRAVGDQITDSKWISATLTTDTEQIFSAIDPEEVAATSAVVRWPAGQVATHILITPGDIQRPVTTEEIAAGAAELTDLISETEYTVFLMNDDKVRGTISFTTLIDVGNVILVNPEDDLVAILEAAEEGDVFGLMPGTYIVGGDIRINTTLDIVGFVPVDRPVILGASFRMFGGAGLRLKDLIMDGTTAPDGNQTIIYNEVLDSGLSYGDVVIEDCVIRNYVKGVFYVNIAALIESVLITNTIYHDIITSGGDFIDFRNGMAKKFDFINNTVYNSAPDRDLFRMDAGGSNNFPGEDSYITVRNNTFFNIIGVNNRRILYIRHGSHQISVTKNIFAQTEANYSNQSTTVVTEMDANNYFNAPNLTVNTFAVHDAGNFTTHNPGFANPAAGNFTVSNDDLKLFRIGDPRWLP